MRTFGLLLLGALATSAAACGSGAPPATSPTPQVADTHGISGVVSGTVDGISRPISGRQVHLWIQSSNRAFTQVVTTDQSGRYTTSVPASRVFATAWHPPDRHQPCVATAAVNRDTTIAASDVCVAPHNPTSIWRSNSDVEKEEVDMRYRAAMLLLFSFGCADGKSPVGPTPSPPGLTELTFSLQGDVRDTASRPLKDASVTVVNGPRAGTTAMTDDAGRFSMPGTFTQAAVTIVASKEGYSPETWSFPMPGRPLEGGNWGFSFRLEPLAPSADLAGEYMLTLTTDNACTRLPEEARTRTYTVSIVSRWRATTFVGTLSGAQIISVPFWSPYFQIDVAEEFANVTLRFAEQLTDGSYLAIEGGTAASIGPSGITAPFNAHFVRCRNQPAWAPGEYWWCGADVQGDECASSNNQLTLLRR